VSAVLDNVAVSVPRPGDRFGLSSRTASGIEKNEHSETRDLNTDNVAFSIRNFPKPDWTDWQIFRPIGKLKMQPPIPHQL
jgi:hypothetical protein